MDRERCSRAKRVTVTPEVKEHLWSALTSLASAPAPERTHHRALGPVAVQRAEAGACSPTRVGGPWGRLLDAETERLGEAEVQAFETEGLIGAGAAPAVLSYLFHASRTGSTGGRPCSSSTKAGSRSTIRGFAGQLREWLKTLRKKNASVIFATQSLADIDGSAIAPAIIESCPTRLFLPNERALEPQIAAIYPPLRAQRPPDRDPQPGDAEARLLLPVAPRQSPVRARARQVALALCGASDPASQRNIDRIIEERGGRGFLGPFLDVRGLGWAAALLDGFNQEGE